MRKPKRPAKFASAEHKRQWEQQQRDWEALNNKWSNVSFHASVPTPDKPKKKKGKAKPNRVVLDPVIAARVEEAKRIKSKPDTVTGAVALKRSVMDPRSLANEAPEVVAQTQAKSQSLMPMYNKGPAQYVTPDIDVTTIGAKSRRP